MQNPDLWLIPFRYSTWATQTLMRACQTLTPAQLDQVFEMGPGTVRRTLLHIVDSEMFWADRLRGRTIRKLPSDTNPSATLQEIAALHVESSAEIEHLADTLFAANALDRVVPSSSDHDSKPIRIASVLTHVVTHGVHHRA